MPRPWPRPTPSVRSQGLACYGRGHAAKRWDELGLKNPGPSTTPPRSVTPSASAGQPKQLDTYCPAGFPCGTRVNGVRAVWREDLEGPGLMPSALSMPDGRAPGRGSHRVGSLRLGASRHLAASGLHLGSIWAASAGASGQHPGSLLARSASAGHASPPDPQARALPQRIPAATPPRAPSTTRWPARRRPPLAGRCTRAKANRPRKPAVGLNLGALPGPLQCPRPYPRRGHRRSHFATKGEGHVVSSPQAPAASAVSASGLIQRPPSSCPLAPAVPVASGVVQLTSALLASLPRGRASQVRRRPGVPKP